MRGGRGVPGPTGCGGAAAAELPLLLLLLLLGAAGLEVPLGPVSAAPGAAAAGEPARPPLLLLLLPPVAELLLLPLSSSVPPGKASVSRRLISSTIWYMDPTGIDRSYLEAGPCRRAGFHRVTELARWHGRQDVRLVLWGTRQAGRQVQE